MQSVDFIISVNVYCSLGTLERQLQSIEEFVQGSYVVVLNSSPDFHACLPAFPANVVVNPALIPKRQFHGSIVHGIFSNMQFATEGYDFEHFIVLSGRTIFYRPMNVGELKRLTPIFRVRDMSETPDEWWWGAFKQTLLAQHYLKDGFKLQKSAHEGMCFGAQACRAIVLFLNKEEAMKENLFNQEYCVEEFALQTIAAIESDGFLYIGNGASEEYDENNPNLFTRKVLFS